jgi:serine/threonine protein kinase
LGSERHPRYVIKISEDPIGEKRLQNECAILKDLASRDKKFSDALPQVLSEGTSGNGFYILSTAKTGSSLINYFKENRNNYDNLYTIFSKVRGWITLLHKETCSIESAEAPGILMNIARESLEFAGKNITLDDTSKYLSDFFNKEILRIERFPFVLQHRDFSPENILYDKTKKTIAIFDWEYALPKGLPLVDLLNLFTNSYLCIRPGAQSVSLSRMLHLSHHFTPLVNRLSAGMFVEIFYKENELSRLIKEQLQSHQKDTGISQRSLKLLFLLFILQHLSHDKVFLEIFLERDDNILWRK